MADEKCLNCIESQRCKDSYLSWVFFIIGLVATVAIRVVTVLMHTNPLAGKIAWYIGVSGFFIFFVYKFKVSQARSKLIRQQNLVSKIRQGRNLTAQDYNLVSAILCGLSSKKERINYLFIFVLSAAALILALYMDFIR